MDFNIPLLFYFTLFYFYFYFLFFFYFLCIFYFLFFFIFIFFLFFYFFIFNQTMPKDTKRKEKQKRAFRWVLFVHGIRVCKVGTYPSYFAPPAKQSG